MHISQLSKERVGKVSDVVRKATRSRSSWSASTSAARPPVHEGHRSGDRRDLDAKAKKPPLRATRPAPPSEARLSQWRFHRAAASRC